MPNGTVRFRLVSSQNKLMVLWERGSLDEPTIISVEMPVDTEMSFNSFVAQYGDEMNRCPILDAVVFAGVTHFRCRDSSLNKIRFDTKVGRSVRLPSRPAIPPPPRIARGKLTIWRDGQFWRRLKMCDVPLGLSFDGSWK